MIDLIEIDTTFDLRGLHGTKQDADWSEARIGSCLTPSEDSSKIVSKSKKWVPYFSIGKSNIPLKFDNYHVGGYWWTDGPGKYFEKRGIIPESFRNPTGHRQELLLPETLVSATIKGLSELWRDGTNPNRYDSSSYLDNLSQKQLRRLAIYYVRRVRDRLEKYIGNKDLLVDEAWEGSRNRGWGGIWKWGDFIQNFWSGPGFVKKRGRGVTPSYIAAPGYIAGFDPETGVTDPLVCLMVKKDYLPYYKGSLIVGDRVDSQYFKLYVKEGFDIKNTSDKNLRPKYRKYIKKVLNEAGVEIIEKKNLNDIFSIYTMPAMKSLAEYNTFLNNASIEVMDYCRVNNIIKY